MTHTRFIKRQRAIYRRYLDALLPIMLPDLMRGRRFGELPVAAVADAARYCYEMATGLSYDGVFGPERPEAPKP